MLLTTRHVPQLAVLGAVLASTSMGLVVKSRADPSVQVSFKETRICETTPGVKSYAGYVTLPPTLDPNVAPYTNNIFFWFFEAQNRPETAPLAVWLQGGPGAPSTDQALSGHNGPWVVNEDSNSTRSNPWAWNKNANMLYIDQPSQVGFTYDEAVEGVLNAVDGSIDTTGADVPLNLTSVKGIFPSQDPTKAANTTQIASRALFHFLQAWFEEFDIYRRDNISIWSQSYGGHFAPALADTIIRERNPATRELSKNVPRGKHGDRTHQAFDIGIDTVGIINGFYDLKIQAESFPDFAVNNTYGIKAYSQKMFANTSESFKSQGGCLDLAEKCNQLMAEGDPKHFANNATVLEQCGKAFEVCWNKVYLPYELESGRNPFDIAHPRADPFPAPFAYGFLNNHWVQEELGVKLNYSQSSSAVVDGFMQSADFMVSYTSTLGRLIDAGVNVALIHGDRDYRCNWFGGEGISLAIKYTNTKKFQAAGYADLITNDTYVGGKVRQHGHFSFARIFQAGHEVPYYQPETAFRIFNRTMHHRDMATGKVSIAKKPNHSTKGPATIFNIRQAPPKPPAPRCYVDMWPLSLSCSEKQIEALVAGDATVVERVVVKPAA